MKYEHRFFMDVKFVYMKKRLITLLIAVIAMTNNAWAQTNKSDNDWIEKTLKSMTMEEKCTLLVGGGNPEINVPGAAGYTRAFPQYHIPATVLCDGPAGLRISPTRENTDHTFYCTGFPVGTLIASSWDPAMVEEMTQAMGNEVLEYGVDVLLALVRRLAVRWSKSMSLLLRADWKSPSGS